MRQIMGTALLGIVALAFCGETVLAADHGTFATFYAEQRSVLGWVTLISTSMLVAIGTAILTVYTCGAATPAWVTAVGGWIGGMMGLHGAAATSAGLALLGGGSLTSGGFGMAGGKTLLIAAATFSTEMLMDYGLRMWIPNQEYSLKEECKDMLYLPCPINATGASSYVSTQKFLSEKIDMEVSLTEEPNPTVIKAAIEKLRGRMSENDFPTDRVKNETMLALLYWLSGDQNSSRKHASIAVAVGNRWNKERWWGNYYVTPTMATFLIAVAGLESWNPEMDEKHLENYHRCLEYSLTQEPDNDLIPLLVGIYLDRFFALYKHEQIPSDPLESLFTLMEHSQLRGYAPVMTAILAGRFMCTLKSCQQDIQALTTQEGLQINGKKEVLEGRMRVYVKLLSLAEAHLIPSLEAYESEIQKNAQGGKDIPEFSSRGMKKLVESYRADIPRLQILIEGC